MRRKSMKKRIEWVDLGKGITILLVVLGHVVLGLYDSGKFGKDNHLLLFLVETVYVFHMPVFFALSGYFFKAENTFKDLIQSLKRKLIALGLPFLAFSIVMFAMKKVGGGSVRNSLELKDLLNIFQVPIDHTWFLYALFGIFVYGGLLQLVVKNDKIIFGIALAGYVVASVFVFSIFIVQRVLIWFPLFYLGKMLRGKNIGNGLIVGTVLAYVGYLVFWSITNFEEKINYSNPGAWGIILFISVILAFGVFSRAEKGTVYSYLKKKGKISLPIYLIHPPVASVLRIVLFKVGISNIAVHIIGGVIIVWFLTNFIYKVISKIKVFDFFVYPLKYVK